MSKLMQARANKDRAEMRDRFIKTLAKYLVEGQVEKSIGLQMGKKFSIEWSELRSQTPLFGYPTVPEAEETLRKFLS